MTTNALPELSPREQHDLERVRELLTEIRLGAESNYTFRRVDAESSAEIVYHLEAVNRILTEIYSRRKSLPARG